MADAKADATTPNYGFTLPTVGGDDNLWGDLLNGNWSSIDTILWNVSGVANGALTQAAGDARYLRLAGGTMTGNLILPALVATSGIAGTTSGDPPVLFVDPPVSDNSLMVPNTRWVNSAISASLTGYLSLSGGTMSGPLVLSGISTCPLAPPGANTSQIASTAFVAAALANVPGPSNTNPLMAGTAVPGSSSQYSRGDHIHPTDTSRAPIASPTFTGAVTLAADPTVNLQAATKQYVDANVIRNAGSGGFVNKFRNGAMSIWQRGVSALPSGAPTADGWYVFANGSALTAAQTAMQGGSSGVYWALVINGAAGNTAASIQQRIESYDAAALNNQTCTFSAYVYQTTGAALAPSLTIQLPTVQDNYTSTTNVVNIFLQSVPNAQWTRVSYTFAMPGNAYLGVAASIGFGALVAGQQFYMTGADLRATPGVAIGLNANPPPVELPPMAIEMVRCQRYYQVGIPNGIVLRGYNVAAATTYDQVFLQTPMRATPSIVGAAFIGTSNATNGSFAMINNRLAQASVAAVAQGDFYATLQFTGFSAEL